MASLFDLEDKDLSKGSKISSEMESKTKLVEVAKD